ncbi:MAG: hypothetical protein J6568_06770 [Snodgrassella sp.]|nr:hypothetical protein [Snodgrassella sp.]
MIVSGFITRLVFGKPEKGISHLNPLAEKYWMPYHSCLSQLLTLGCGVGITAGYLGISFGSNGALLAFGMFAFFLMFLHFNTNVPISHYICLLVATVVSLSGSIIRARLIGIGCDITGRITFSSIFGSR